MGALGLSIRPFCRGSIGNPSVPQLLGIYPEFVPFQGPKLQIIECPVKRSWQEYCRDQNLHFQFLSNTVAKPIVKLRWIVVGLSFTFVNNKGKCSGMPCSRETTHNVGECTGSNWLLWQLYKIRCQQMFFQSLPGLQGPNVCSLLHWGWMLMSGWLIRIPVSYWAKSWDGSRGNWCQWSGPSSQLQRP